MRIKQHTIEILILIVCVVIVFLAFAFLMVPNYRECQKHGFSDRYCMSKNFLR